MQKIGVDYRVDLSNAGPYRTSILELWRLGFGSIKADRFDWLYCKAPDEPICALLHNGDGHLAGMIGLLPRRVWVNGDERLAGHTVDLVVEQPYRTAGPAMHLHREVMSAAAQVGMTALYGFSLRANRNDQRRSFRLLAKRERWLRIINFRHVLPKPIKDSRWGRIAALPFNLALRLVSRLSRQKGPWRAEIVRGFDPRFDALWEQARGRFPMVGERSARYLNWRFGQAPEGPSQVIALSGAAGDLLAYAIYTVEDHVATIRDLLSADAAALDRLLSELVRHAQDTGLWAVDFVFFGAAPVSAALRRRGFIRRPEQSSVLVQFLSGAADSDWQRWYLTDADRDMSLAQ